MLDKITESLTNKIRKENPDIDEERAEVINYGLQILIGEVPKIFIALGIAYLLGILKLTVITFMVLIPYKCFSGGFHLKTHIGCIISTTLFYCGIPFLAKNIILDEFMKCILILLVGIFGIIMIKLYAPADTEDVPILNKKVRKQKQFLSYISFCIGLISTIFIKDNIVSNIVIIGYFLQTCMITKLAYKITKNKFGYEVYKEASEINS